MIDLSLSGLLGAIVGTVVAAFAYGPLAAAIERAFRARAPSASEAERATLEQEMSLLRRAVLAGDIIVFAGIGYWLGGMIGG
jgi:hypothetical protein